MRRIANNYVRLSDFRHKIGELSAQANGSDHKHYHVPHPLPIILLVRRCAYPDELRTTKIFYFPIFPWLQASFLMEIMVEACSNDGHLMLAFRQIFGQFVVSGGARQIRWVCIVVEYPDIHRLDVSSYSRTSFSPSLPQLYFSLTA